jgi:hypothetical protein
MITYYFLYLCTGLLSGFALPISYLPDAGIPAGFSGWLALAGGYISIATKLMPLTIAALFVVVGMIVVVENADGIFKVAKWIYTKIPGIS